MNTALTDPKNPGFMELTNRITAHRWGMGKDMQDLAISLPRTRLTILVEQSYLSMEAIW